MEKFFAKNKKAIYIFIAFLSAGNIFAWQEVFYLSQDRNLKVGFLDVGQGDAIFIESPQRHQILIDGGPSDIVLEKIAKQMPFWDRTLDMVVLTHPEKDHMQGLVEVLKRYKVDYILWPGIKRNNSEYLEWLKVLVEQKNNGAKIITAVKGQKITAGHIEFDIINPQENMFGMELEKTSNNASVVAKMVYNNKSFLFTGDIDAKTEEKISEIIDVKSDVLKVAHHGSKYSTSAEFLQKVSPKIAVVSVGKNSYGHPTLEVLSRLQNIGSAILRTDQRGDIILAVKGGLNYFFDYSKIK